MANNEFLNLVNTNNEVHEYAPQIIDSINSLEIIKMIMYCDKQFMHPIHRIITSDFKKDMRRWYILYKANMTYLMARMSRYPYYEKHTKGYAMDFEHFMKLNTHLKNNSWYTWYNLHYLELLKYFRKINEDLEKCVNDLDMRVTILQMIHQNLVELVDITNPSCSIYLYLKDLDDIILMIFLIEEFLKMLRKRIEKESKNGR